MNEFDNIKRVLNETDNNTDGDEENEGGIAQETNNPIATKNQHWCTNGAKMVYLAMHPSLEKLPCKSACCIATIVIFLQALFVISLTWYNWTTVNMKIAVIDARWELGDDNPYRMQFKRPTQLCQSWRSGVKDDSSIVYELPCLLPGLTCEENYGDSKCPEYYNFECSNNLESCGISSTASVLYVERPLFTVAFGSALGYVLYVQTVVLALCLAVYYYCWKRASVSVLKEEVVAVASKLFK